MMYMYAEVRLAWGFAVRWPGRAVQHPAILPPPTTVAGCFASYIAKVLGVEAYGAGGVSMLHPSKRWVLEATRAAAAGLLRGALKVGYAVRRMLADDKGGENVEVFRRTVRAHGAGAAPEVAQALMPAKLAGAVYGPGSVLALFWAFDPDRLAEGLSRYARVSADDVRRAAADAAWAVDRVGTAEGAVDVVRAEAGEAEEFSGRAETWLYWQAGCGRGRRGVHVVTLWDLDYAPAEFAVPADLVSGRGWLVHEMYAAKRPAEVELDGGVRARDMPTAATCPRR